MKRVKRHIAFLYLIIFGVFAISPLMGSADDASRLGASSKPTSMRVEIYLLNSVLSFFDDSLGNSDQPADNEGGLDVFVRKARAVPKCVDFSLKISTEGSAFSSYLSIPDVNHFTEKAVSTFRFADDAVPRPLTGYAASYSGLSPPHFLFS